MKNLFKQKPVFYGVVVFVVFVIWGLTLRNADAAEARIALGKGVTNDNEWTMQEISFSHEDWYVSAAKLGGDDIQPDTWRFATGFRLDWRKSTDFSPFLKFGVAWWNDEPLPLISDRFSYDMGAGVRLWEVMDLEWQHNSTAGRSDFNKGNDIFTLGVVWQF